MSSQSASVSPLLQRIQIGKYDISDFVMSCEVMKSLKEPAGFFSMNLRPEIIDNAIVDFSDIHVNDFVEIRVGRFVVQTSGGMDAPIVMRGMVDAIEISESYSQGLDGTPQRTVSVSGRDLSKLIIDKSLWIPQEQFSDYSVERSQLILDLQGNLLDSQENEGEALQELKPWIEGIMKKVFTDPLVGFDVGNNISFTIDVNLPKNSLEQERVKSVTSFTLSSSKGTLFNYIDSYITRPFMEMFIEDYETETKLKIRWAPFRDRNGDFPYQALEHMGAASPDGTMNDNAGNARFWWDTKRDPSVIEIGSNEIMQKSIRRHSGDVYTYFFTTWSGFKSADPAAGDRPVWDSAEKPVVQEPEAAMLGPKKYLNMNPRFNPQYDFIGIKRFGLKPLVVPIPFWTQDDQGSEESTTTTSRTVAVVDATETTRTMQVVDVANPTTPASTSKSLRSPEAALLWAKAQPSSDYVKIENGQTVTYCEMFTRKAYNSSILYPTAWANASRNRTSGSLADAKIGSLIFFKQDKSNGNAGHVALITRIEEKASGAKLYYMLGAVNSGLKEEPVNSAANPYWVKLFYGIGSAEKSYGAGATTVSGVTSTITPVTEEDASGKPTATRTVIVDTATAERPSDEISALLDDCNQWMYDTLRQMDKVYTGKMRLIGNPFVKIGMELVIDDDKERSYSSFKSTDSRVSTNSGTGSAVGSEILQTGIDRRERYYIESVHHSWSVFPSPNFMTEVGLTRGIFVNGSSNVLPAGDEGGFTATQTKWGTEKSTRLTDAEMAAINGIEVVES